MNGERKPAHGGNHERAGTETAAFGGAAISYCNDTTSTPNVQSIFDLLPRGEANAIDTKTLVALTGCKSARDLQNRIAAEREQGKLILSSCRHGGGYFVPSQGAEGKAEIAAFVATLRARALNTLKILKAAKEALAEIAGQLDFTDLEGV